MYRTSTSILAFFMVNASCCAQVGSGNNTPGKAAIKHEFRYTNPITRDTSLSMRDHFIIKAGNKWYCTGTSNPVWTAGVFEYSY